MLQITGSDHISAGEIANPICALIILARSSHLNSSRADCKLFTSLDYRIKHVHISGGKGLRKDCFVSCSTLVLHSTVGYG